MSRPRDTDAASYEAQLDVFRRMSGSERLAIGLVMADEGREILRAGIRHRHPDYDERDVEMALRRLLLGDDMTLRAWPHEWLREP